jgi:hypothetical protein
MRPVDMIKLVTARFLAKVKRPMHIEGSAGIGKTQIVGQAARALNVGFKVIHAPLMQPEDYGLPIPTADRKSVNFAVSMDKFPLVGSDCPETGIFLIDELPQADQSAQKILRNMIQEREIHGHKLKPGWAIVSTGNRVKDRAGANRLLSHLSNVLTRVELEVSTDDWVNWALDNNVKTEVIAFIRFRPALLNDFDGHRDVNATPRAWVEGVSDNLGIVDSTLEHQVFMGDVGEGPAAEFLNFLRIYRKLPSVDAVIMNPTTIEVPKDPATQYAIVGALTHKTSVDNFARVMQFIKRMPPEFAVLYIRDVIRMVPAIQSTKDFISWASKDGAKILG